MHHSSWSPMCHATAAAASTLLFAMACDAARAQAILAFNFTGDALECRIVATRADGTGQVLHTGAIDVFPPTYLPLPAGFWPQGATRADSPAFGSIELDCSMPAALQPLARYRKTLRASSGFWTSDLSGTRVLPNASTLISLSFGSRVDFDSDTEDYTEVLTVKGAYAPVVVIGGWEDSNWQSYRFPKELKRAPQAWPAAGI